MNRRAVPALGLLLAVAALLPDPASAQTAAGWNRYPAISPDGSAIVFTYQGDLYRVPTAGGTAIPLTSHPAHDFMPVWSADGRHIAFASNRHGNFDVFVMPAAGGEAVRLTLHSADELPYAFESGDGAVLFGAARQDLAEHRGFPTGSQPELYRVPVGGGRVRQVLTTPAELVRPGGNGRFLLYQDKKGGENEWRKHHTSSIARDIWLYDTAAGTHRKLTTFAGEDRNPVPTPDGQAFYYLSEESGSFNVHRMALSGGASERITTFQGPPVRFLSMAGDGTLAFSWDGEIYTKSGTAGPRKVPVTVLADAKANNERVVPVTGGATEMALSPSGKEVAFVARGEVFVTSIEGGMTKQVTRTPEREGQIAFSPDGSALVYSAQRDGRWAIYEARRARAEEPHFYAATLIQEKALIRDAHENTQPLFSPDGKELAYVQDRNTLRVRNLQSGQDRTLLTQEHIFSTRVGGQYFRWSPDGKSILFDYSIPGLAPGEVGLVAADGTAQPRNLTLSGFQDGQGEWVLGGKALIWQSNRDGLKSVAQSGASQSDVYAMFLTQDAWDRFRLTKEEYTLLKEMEEKNRPKGDTAKADTAKGGAPVALELDGSELRKARLTIHSSVMGDALLSKDGETLYYLARFERGMNLWSTEVRTRETKMVAALNANRASMVWDKDQKSIFLLSDGSISKVDPSSGKRDNVTIRGEMTADLAAERAHDFEHVWTQTKETFYTAGYHGVDWVGIKPVYEKYLPHIGNAHEFAEMLSEMLGELNISHSGARYAASEPTDDATASLGIFYDQAWDGPGIKVVEVIRNGPLDKAGMDVQPGMIIESVDGEPIAADADPAAYLNRKAAKRTLLVVAEGSRKRELVVTPITTAQEGPLLYDRWVRRNREEVDRVSGGTLGYIHIPGMSDGAFRTAFEEVLGRFPDRAGLVVDTRFNGGGDLVADLDMFLTGERFFTYTTDTRATGYEPNFRWTKPSVSLAGEANYSDGHCYAYVYKELKIGPLVGMPTPGTCTFAGWETLPDGTRWGVPGMGVKNNAGRYLENLQTEPDIQIFNEQGVVSRGRDQQLEAAVAELRKRVR
ncbi:MAG TPA: S41 family peptidase [Longimicrobiales bacterium]|nr:S41 family peptidase [Longimicrobiales bacterium]